MLVLTIISFLCLLLFAVLVAIYATSGNTLSFTKRVHYTNEVTVLAGEPFDLRYYKKLKLNITSEPYYHSHVYNASLCQINCTRVAVEDEQLVTMLPINHTRSVPSQTRTFRTYLHFSDDQTHTPNVFMLKGSVIKLRFEAAAAQQDSGEDVPNITLNWLGNLDDCENFVDGAEEPHSTTHLQLRDLGHLFHNDSNYSEWSEEGEFVCVVMELSPGFNYTYTVTGMARQFRSATSLQSDINTRCLHYENITLSLRSNEGVEIILNRPLKSRSSLESQRTCVLVTLEKEGKCKDESCTLYLNALLSYTPENVRVVVLSACGVLCLLTLSAFLIVSVAVCYKT